jgi:alpha-aminoadipic semialdehyde synthase
MQNVIGILREGSSKRGERRTAITPDYARHIAGWGHKLIVQPAVNPKSGEIKRAFKDDLYKTAGAEISEDLSEAALIFGLKEIDIYKISPGKAFCLFSHIHKGQIKNRALLKAFVNNKATVIDYELIRDDKHRRLITAFTYNAGYAGMVDTLWTLGIRLKNEGIRNPFSIIPQAIDGKDLQEIKDIISAAGEKIKSNGTPNILPPVITVFLGKGKTSHGAQEIYDMLPSEKIQIEELDTVIKTGSRKKVYKLVLSISDIYRPKPGHKKKFENYEKLTEPEKDRHYMMNPELYESNLDKILPFSTVMMNCINWSPKFPRVLPKGMMKEVFTSSGTLQAIGDITCDPNGSIEFSKETWIDNPVYIYDPLSDTIKDGFEGRGVAVMAVTNLPCEFSEDASRHFGSNIFPFLKDMVEADYSGKFENSGLPPEIKRAVILWHGEFTTEYNYMQQYIV